MTVSVVGDVTVQDPDLERHDREAGLVVRHAGIARAMGRIPI